MKNKFYIISFFIVSVCYTQLLQNTDINSIKSLAIPGWGELSLNEKQRSKVFFIAESALWFSYLTSHYSNNWYIDNYTSFASHHAGINLNNISDNQLSLLIVHMSQYDNMELYNETMDRQHSQSEYPDNSGYNWDWDNDTNRKTFNDLRIKSSGMNKINSFTISALIINRLISFFDVIYLNNKKNKIQTSVLPISDNGLLLNLHLNF